MSRARLLILLFAVGCAVLAGLLAWGMLGQSPKKPVAAAPPKPVTVPVLVAAKDLAVGERLNGLSVEWQAWPRGNVASTMITQEARPDAVQQLEGSRVRIPILMGEPVSERKLVPAKEGGLMSALLPKGMRAISIRISDRSAASGFILPNDRVDIIGNFRVALNSRGDFDRGEIMFSRSIITNVRVLAINRAVSQDADSASLPNLKTAVVELDPEQVEIVTRAEMQGDLTLALRSIDEDDGEPNQKPQLSASTEDPDAVRMFAPYGRSVLSCKSDCMPTLQMGNAPFPLVVNVDADASNR